MNKGGMGTGSALIMLVFVVLCLTIFALISLSSATADKALADAAARMATSYYEADALAETIVAEIVAADLIPTEIQGVEIFSGWAADADVAMFSCPISDTKELYVEIAIFFGSYEVREWRMRDIGDGWALIDEPLPVWLGD